MIRTNEIVKIERPDTVDYFLGLALLIAQKSTDSQTKHGCIITTKDNRILGTGYNGLLRDIPIEAFPNVRPSKYDWMTHSEDSCLDNCIVSPKVVGGGIAYVTGRCCLKCTIRLWQNHVEEIYQIDAHGWYMNDVDEENEKKEYLAFQSNGKLKLHYIKPNLDWMERAKL